MENLILSLTELHDSKDPEKAHLMADALLINYINNKDVQDAFEKVPRYYA